LLVESIDYTHPPLPDQFSRFGIRQIELDLFLDPKGGHYARPSARQTLKLLGKNPGDDPNRDSILEEPGLKVLHVPDVDYATTAPTFVIALNQIRDWSRQNKNHVPIMVLVELKDSRIPGPPTVPIAFDETNINSVDAEIRSVFQASEIFTPDQLRGEMQSLPEAIAKTGWPRLDSLRGKIIFALDNEGNIRDFYLKNHSRLEGRVMFVTPPAENHSSAAFFKINDPIRDFDKIQRLVKSGYIVRTRADADTRQARSNDTTKRDLALASGAQFVSTDYPVARKDFSDYCVSLPGNVIARPNPVSGKDLPQVDLEKSISSR
ncbi:MAG: Ca2+-dependent phosphoinositide-specific phospholipase C, partial [Isosphaeraceae bacterium]